MADTPKTLREALFAKLPEKGYLGDDASYGYDDADMVEFALAAIAAQAQAEHTYVADMTCSSCYNEGSDACMSCDALDTDLPPTMYQAKRVTDDQEKALQAQQ